MFTNTKGEKIYFSNSLSNDKIFNISLIGKTTDIPGFVALHKTSGNRELDKYTFEYVCDGIGYIETQERKYTVRAGDAFILNKTASHYYYSDKEHPLAKLFIVCHGTLVDTLMSVYGIRQGTVIKALNLEPDFQALIDATVRAPESVTEIASGLILKFLQRVSNIKQVQQESDVPLHQLIAQYIHENVSFPLTIDDLCACFDISTSTLFRIFDRHFQATPKQYITNAKLDEAKNLLITTTLSVGDIASRLSFPYPNNFSAIFTRTVGCSPREYRKNNPYIVHKENFQSKES